MLDKFAQFAKFSDEEIGQMVYTLLLENKRKGVFLNRNLNKEFIKSNFAKGSFQERMALAENYSFTSSELESILESEKSIKVVNKLIEHNSINLTSADRMLERYGSKVIPGLYRALGGSYQYFEDKIRDLRNKDLIEFIFLNSDALGNEIIGEIVKNSNNYFSPNSYTNLLFSLLVNKKPELIDIVVDSEQSNIFDSTIASHTLISEIQLEKLYRRLESSDYEQSKYALMALSSNPATKSELLEIVKASALDNEVKALAVKNLLKQEGKGFDRRKAILERALPSKFKPEGRLGVLASYLLGSDLTTDERAEILEVFGNLPANYNLVREFLGLPKLDIEVSDFSFEPAESALAEERLLNSQLVFITPSMVPQLSQYLELKFGKEISKWQNFFTLSISHEGDIKSLVETSRKL